MIPEISSIISNIASIFIAVTIPTFTFATTLLKNAVSKFEAEQKTISESHALDEETRIAQIKKKVKSLSGKDSKEKQLQQLREELEALTKQQRKNKKEKRKNEARYGALRLNHSVTIPTVCLLIVIVLCNVATFTFNKLTVDTGLLLKVLLLCLSVIFLVYAFYKIYCTLSLVEEVSMPGEDFQTKQFADAVGKVLKEHFSSQEEEARIDFGRNIILHAGELATLKFGIRITKGRVIKDAQIFFYFREGFSLPDGVPSVTQRAEFSIPRALTLIKDVGDVSIGIRRPSEIEFFVPKETGKYIISYQIFGQGYKKDIENLCVEVVDKQTLDIIKED